MPKNQTGNHTTVPKVMGKGPKYPFAFYVALVLSMTVGAAPVLAAGDPLAVINNLSTFIFSLIRAIGLILLGFGVVQVGLSLKSHDPSQRANGFLTLAGGVIITFAKEMPLKMCSNILKHIEKLKSLRILLTASMCMLWRL